MRHVGSAARQPDDGAPGTVSRGAARAVPGHAVSTADTSPGDAKARLTRTASVWLRAVGPQEAEPAGGPGAGHAMTNAGVLAGFAQEARS
ncbi:hypothetical protein [Microbispora sp. CA-102843]|uniref:hypothetical protein n=1 Tax=Microbispora sp. CA-102843 TaxID=3239952 RepID=UPI003D8B824F